MIKLFTLVLLPFFLISCLNTTNHSDIDTFHNDELQDIMNPSNNEEERELVVGDTIGNGGGAWLCEKEGETTLLQLDLYEASHLHQITSFETKADYREIIEVIANRIEMSSKKLATKFRAGLSTFYENAKDTTAPLTKILDYGALVQPKECDRSKYVSIINYAHQNVIYIYRPYFEELKEIEKASLLTHEILYKIRRDQFNENHSIPSRLATAYLFSANWNQYQKQFSKLFKIKLHNNRIKCKKQQSAIRNYECYQKLFKSVQKFVPHENTYECRSFFIQNHTEEGNKVMIEYKESEITTIHNFYEEGKIHTTTATAFLGSTVSANRSAYGHQTFEKVLDFPTSKVIIRSVDSDELVYEVIQNKSKDNTLLSPSIALGEQYKAIGYGACYAN
jgi:hypothetical protein